jgi:hypothetical protein
MSENQLTITHPKPYQVIQRSHYSMTKVNGTNPDESNLGYATLKITGLCSKSYSAHGEFEVRTILLDDAYGMAIDWKSESVEWQDEQFTIHIDIPAGGWYRLELRYIAADHQVITSALEPFGVGEVFIIAGQSYAENCNDEYTRIEDLQGRVSGYHLLTQQWRIAHDPQPSVIALGVYDKRYKGTIWPSAMNHLLRSIKVPIGMVNVAVGATASRQWLPGKPLFRNLLNAGIEVGNFRALLWQQGESDVIEETSLEVYKLRIIEIKAELERQWGHSFLWLPAKSTIHPTLYNKPLEAEQIRNAIADLWNTKGFLPGPDTDVLDGIGLYRAPKSASEHFTLLGQQQAGILWSQAIINMLQLS